MEFIKYNNIEDFMKENFELILEKEWLNPRQEKETKTETKAS